MIYDQIFNKMCARGDLRCEARPLVSESGVPSTLQNSKTLRWCE